MWDEKERKGTLMVFTASPRASANTSGPYNAKYLARVRVRATTSGDVHTCACANGTTMGVKTKTKW